VKILYIAGPYSAEHEIQKLKNYQQAWDVARLVWTMPGFCAVCPHANTWLMGGPDIDWEKFLEGDEELIRRSDGLVMLPYWVTSKGAAREYELARKLGLPVLDMHQRLWSPREGQPATLRDEILEVFRSDQESP
jgi:hypothetical protein